MRRRILYMHALLLLYPAKAGKIKQATAWLSISVKKKRRDGQASAPVAAFLFAVVFFFN
jgi:hypothetical protein